MGAKKERRRDWEDARMTERERKRRTGASSGETKRR